MHLNKEGPMIKPQFGFVLEYVKDIEAAKRFYVEVLGLQMNACKRLRSLMIRLRSVSGNSNEASTAARARYVLRTSPLANID